ncbi:hypothetical protein Rctr197k_092 [Virus Rctr197k]|nr:hypothetical protein Rctr197k_092 [Virus Rctr197k]
MDRSLFPENVEVHQTHLQNTEDTRAYHILQRTKDGSTTGVASGLTVTVNATSNTLVDIEAGWGYCPNGELVETTAATPSIALSSYASGVDNYVCLIYTENETHPEAAATGGRTRATRAERAYRVRVYTLTELQALAATSDDLSVDATDRALIVAVVNANGPAIALTAGDITNIPAITQEIIGIDQPASITGVVVVGVDPDTALTREETVNPLARIVYTSGATPPATSALTYRAPGDAAAGDAVTIATSGTYRLYTDAGSTGTWIDVEVTVELLALNATVTTTDDLEVFDVYYNSAQRFSAADFLHRGTVGTGAPNRDNPHGMRVRDLDDRIIEAQWGIVAGAGLLANADQATVPRLVTAQSTFGASRTLLWQIPMAAGLSVRIYADSATGSSYGIGVTVNARWDGAAAWAKDNNAEPSSLWSFENGGIEFFGRPAGAGTWAVWDKSPLLISSIGGDSGFINALGYITVGANILSSSSARAQERIRADFSPTGGGGDLRTLLFRSRRTDTSGATNLRVYRAVTTLAGAQSNALEIVVNASWNAGTTQWDKDDAASAAMKLEIGAGFSGILRRLAGSGANFDDTISGAGWDGAYQTFSSIGTFSAANNVVATGNVQGANFIWSPAQSFVKSIPGGAAAINPTGSAFVTVSGPFGNPEGGGGCHFEKTTALDFAALWPLELPQGAVVTASRLRGNFTNNAGQIRATIIRVARAAGTIVAFRAGGTPYDTLADGLDVDRTLTIDEVLAVRTIDNANYSYAVWVGGNGAAANESVRVWSVEVTYEVGTLALG